MTEKTTSLTPEEWKQLCLLNVTQLHNFLQGVPAQTEGGVAGISDQHLALIEGHLQRGSAFLRAWQKSRPVIPVAKADDQSKPVEANGVKRKGGWPKGKKRTPRGEAQEPAP